MTALKTIGVLGGMGPQATALFMQKMISSIKAEDDADHIPLLIDSNTQVPSRIRAIVEGTGEDPAPVLAHMAAKLEAAGATALAMPCNTAHFYAPVIETAVTIPFLNMLELSARRAASICGSGGRVAVLGSPALRMTGVFEAPLAALGLVPAYWDDDDELLAIIREVKRTGPSGPLENRLARIADAMARAPADVIMVCCTEFSLLAHALNSRVPVFDTLDVLIEACVDYATGSTPSDRTSQQHRSESRQTTDNKKTSTNLLGKEPA